MNTTEIDRIDRQIERLQRKRVEAIERFLSDCEWMDVPVLRVDWLDTPQTVARGDLLHVLRSTDEQDGFERVSAHHASGGECRMSWCEQKVNAPKRTRQRKGHGTVFTFLGEWVVAVEPAASRARHGTMDGYLLVPAAGSLAGRATRLSALASA